MKHLPLIAFTAFTLALAYDIACEADRLRVQVVAYEKSITTTREELATCYSREADLRWAAFHRTNP